jgi:predicted ArsR family transcriptional regulator
VSTVTTSDNPGQTRRPATAAEMKALSHPLRLRILRLCLDRALTNKEIAEQLGRAPGAIQHHVRLLQREGFLQACRPRPGPRGSTEKPYRATGKSWTLDIGEDGEGGPTFAALEAFREEAREAGPARQHTMIRFALRMNPGTAAEFKRRLQDLIDEHVAAPDPDGRDYGGYVGLHLGPEAEQD